MFVFEAALSSATSWPMSSAPPLCSSVPSLSEAATSSFAPRRWPPQRYPAPVPVAAAPVRRNLFPSFELPDFFTIPFVAFRS